MDWSSVPVYVWVIVGVVALAALMYVAFRLGNSNARTRRSASPFKTAEFRDALDEPAPTAAVAPRRSTRRKSATFKESMREDPVSRLETFQTTQGAVIVGWKDEKEHLAHEGRAVFLLGGVLQAAFNKKIIPDELISAATEDDDGPTRFDDVHRRIGNILKVNPRADLKNYEVMLEIEITLQEGPSGDIPPAKGNPFFDFDKQLAVLQGLADIERFYEEHREKYDSPSTPKSVRESFLGMINRHKKRILDAM